MPSEPLLPAESVVICIPLDVVQAMIGLLENDHVVDAQHAYDAFMANLEAEGFTIMKAG